jgi:hypothetical protein
VPANAIPATAEGVAGSDRSQRGQSLGVEAEGPTTPRDYGQNVASPSVERVARRTPQSVQPPQLRVGTGVQNPRDIRTLGRLGQQFLGLGALE